jgi:hypothetical protein
MEAREDAVIEEMRAARRRASQACGHDAARLVEYYMRLQERYEDRLLESDSEAEQREPEAQPSATAPRV